MQFLFTTATPRRPSRRDLFIRGGSFGLFAAVFLAAVTAARLHAVRQATADRSSIASTVLEVPHASGSPIEVARTPSDGATVEFSGAGTVTDPADAASRASITLAWSRETIPTPAPSGPETGGAERRLASVGRWDENQVTASVGTRDAVDDADPTSAAAPAIQQALVERVEISSGPPDITG